MKTARRLIPLIVLDLCVCGTIFAAQVTMNSHSPGTDYQKTDTAYNPTDAPFNAACDGLTEDTAAFIALRTVIGSTPATIRMPGGRQCKVGTLSLPANVTVDYTEGGAFKLASGSTLTVNGAQLAPAAQIFYNALPGQSAVILSSQVVWADWWGGTLEQNITAANAALGTNRGEIWSRSAAMPYGIVSPGHTLRQVGGPVEQPITFTDPVYYGNDNLVNGSRLRNALTSRVVANVGGQYLPGRNSSHGNFFLDTESSTPTEAVNINYVVRNYAKGDAGFGAGVSQAYGVGLVRGIEHHSESGSIEFSATLVGGATGSTVLRYTSALNEGTLGAGRELIDTSIADKGMVAGFSGSTVVGSGTRWTRALIGQFFKMDVDDRTLGDVPAGAWYKITGVADATHVTLERNYGGGAAAGVFTISPGAEVIAFDPSAGTLTLAANSVGWANGHRVKLRIFLFSFLTPFVGIIRQYLPFTNVQNAAFIAESSTSPEQVGAAFEVAANSKFDTGFFVAGTSRIGIDLGSLNLTSNHAIEVAPGKRISWGGSSLSDNNPGIWASATDVYFGLYPLTGNFWHFRKLNDSGDVLTIDPNNGNVKIPGLLVQGEGAVLSVSGNTITPTNTIHHVGAGLVKNIALPSGFNSGTLYLIADAGSFTMDTSGNIAKGVNPGPGDPVICVYSSSTSKWYCK